ncbi:hypothetical protein D1B31_18350 [Neobacillus notoginsengisoli]|uniref:Uncharacterized protein n=2 Tax=Neobacillus notoginsengisoli TaxID=1578198 RepID=A0A417YPX3_9BACI|nr:hypothetical protein D1B31_18350 [Neobacillus notoginsengisoli]
MISLEGKGLSALKAKSLDEAARLEEFVSGITLPLFKGTHCTIWAEDETIVKSFRRISEHKVFYKENLITYGEMLGQILNIHTKGIGIKNIVIDNIFEWSDNWIYEDCGVWIMTANHFFTYLYVAFKTRNFPTKKLEAFAEEFSFSFEIQGEGGTQ